MLRNSNGIVLAVFPKHVGCIESNEVEVVATLEAVQLFSVLFQACVGK